MALHPDSPSARTLRSDLGRNRLATRARRGWGCGWDSCARGKQGLGLGFYRVRGQPKPFRSGASGAVCVSRNCVTGAITAETVHAG